MWQSKREKQLEALSTLQAEKIARIESASLAARFVPIAVPQATDMQAWYTHIAALGSDPLYLFYLTQLRREIIDNFETDGKTDSEFYRGQLAVIGKIFLDARKAANSLTGVGDAI